ncbi:transcription factor Mbp1 [Pseudohyphozyma bogoriensis]|nr:transcription factor Mbp1 [Pseudohyphozyma bogoriensis]
MPSFSPSSATYFTQPPRRYFVHLKTPLGNKSYSSTPLISIHATVFTDCICLGVTYPHGVFDGVGIGHVLKALGAELHGREWAVPELDEANIVTQLLDGCDVSPDDSLVSKNYTRANVWGLVTFLVSMAVQYVWHGVEPGGIHVGKEVVDRIVKKVKEEVRVESGGKEYVSTSDVMLAWALKAAYLDESVSSTPLKVAQSVSPRQVDASFEQYPHNATLLADLPPLSLASLASTPLSTLALQSRVSIVRTRSLANAKLQLLSPTGAILPRREWGTEWFGFSSQVKGGYDQIEWGTETRCIVGYPLPLNADHLLFVYELNGCYTFVGDLKKSRWESMKSELKRLEEGNVSKPTRLLQLVEPVPPTRLEVARLLHLRPLQPGRAMSNPQIYKATYSSVPVYETPCQGVAVMRRKADSWLNATQILKVAGFDKPQRTRVLEREVQKGTHEKVQGGYGKYQGTWVPMDRGIALARQYGVDRLLQPIFDYVPTADSPPLAPKHITAIPVSRNPKGKKGDLDDGDAASLAKTSRAAANKGNAARKAADRRAQEDGDVFDSEDESMVLQDGASERSVSPTPSDASLSSLTPSPLASEIGDGADYQAAAGGSSSGVATGAGGGGAGKKRKHQEMAPASAHSQLGMGPLRYARMILDYFVSESTQIPQFLVNPPPDFDANVVIDDDGHTALHWACAMGRIRIVKLLLTAGADIFRANSLGQTALMRSVMFTNNYDLRKFPELFELLHRSTINIDRNDRTVFHYIVDIALQKGKTHAARYYIENVLARLIDYPKEVADILNFQDEEGETALTLAARARSKRLVKILLDNGADPKIMNRDGKTAEDYILEDERFRETELGVPAPGPSVITPFVAQLHTSEVGQRASTKCVPQMAELLEQLATSFDVELAEKDRDVQQAQALLANIDAEIAESQRTVEQLKTQASRMDLLEAREQALVAELENKMGKRFRLGWEKWVRDEDAREQEYERSGGVGESDLDALQQLSKNPPPDAVSQAATIRAEIEQTKGSRKELFAQFARLQAESGTGHRMGQYRQLIALGCGVGNDQVDSAINALLSTMDQRDEGFA